ncbi:hypothetical protein B4U80_09122 [Leptotrombidium deliense]|uniref:K Homology domain-containing protein n=1 Tax=Leptotrombidium deliense TaxID=299467 RepID=A0A443SUI4_9ACAR|nr:hypothetical protein B4U80_09122 [Leptotrombidium deliense]
MKRPETDYSHNEMQHRGASDLLKILENLELTANNGNYDDNLITDVCDYLKSNGSCLDESPLKDQIDIYFNVLRNMSRDNRLDANSRARLLEVIELRAFNWVPPDEVTNFYQKTYCEIETNANILHHGNYNVHLDVTTSSSTSAFTTNSVLSVNSLAPTEVIKASGKFIKPAKVPGKNFVKDEFVIRNSDSGKERCQNLSFLTVNTGAKERLLQITGPNEESINRAKYLIEDTIKRNASPVPPENQQFHSLRNSNYSSSSLHGGLTPASSNSNLNRSASNVDNVFGAITAAASTLPFVQAIGVGSEVIIVSSSCGKLSEKAKCILEQHFNTSQSVLKRSVDLHENARNMGYEASESSDSEVFVACGKIPTNVLANRDTDARSPNGESLKQAFGYQLPRQTSFHSSQTSTSTTKMDDDCKISLQKSSSQGCFPPGRTSMRYLNADFDVDNEEMRSNQKCNLITYERDFLLECSKSEISNYPPAQFDFMLDKFPDIIRYSNAMKEYETITNRIESNG